MQSQQAIRRFTIAGFNTCQQTLPGRERLPKRLLSCNVRVQFLICRLVKIRS